MTGERDAGAASAARSLAGRRILVTRASAQSAALRAALAARGAAVIECPLLRTEPLPSPAGPPDLGSFQWLVVTSPNGVRHLHDLLAAARPVASLPERLRIAAVGPGTAAALAEFGRTADLVPATATGAGLGEALRAAGLAPASRVLRVRGDRASTEVDDALASVGASVVVLTVYRTLILPPPPAAAEVVARRDLDAVVFASGSAVAGFAAAFPAHGLGERVLAACLGPVTARAAAESGWRRLVVAEQPSAEGLAAILAGALGPAGDR
ncbi:MAG TPA: uroporphyrinogen-III synthase [Candidatus Krumholzibacteria bacterium]|nr:uroporphyrinogen-III synthase [Candidatus Krumholzibacteria bacterium]HPD70495.1 uroporphyrinogen-III synthase [Candidatus Krumholzibacteria bacterium]HRY39805.1 uroporphyrinogen-III synthase [Candidatus Krumholzibacteria bacterium]